MKTIFIGIVLASLAGVFYSKALPYSSLLPLAGTPAKRDTTTLNGHWYLLPVLPSDTATGHLPSLTFNVKTSRFTGNTGCNSIGGRFELSGKSLRFDSNLITTKMVCQGYNEMAFVKSLLRVTEYRIEDGVLVLMTEGTQLSRWTRESPGKKRLNKAA